MNKIKITNSIVSVTWLAENLSADNLIIFDASMKPIVPVLNAAPEIPTYIPGSLRFDFDDVLRDPDSSLPHTMPSPELFTNEMQKMGVNHDSAIVAYDKIGIYSSPRAWWMLRAMGHDQVAVLDGGLPAWIQAGYERALTLATPKRRGDFTAHPQGGLIVDSNFAVEAERRGMVNRVVPVAELDQQSRALALEIAAMHPHALAMAKRAVNQTLDTMGQYAALQSCFDIHQLGHASAYAQGGQFVLTDHHGIKAANKK